jgi:hypothetical protein
MDSLSQGEKDVLKVIKSGIDGTKSMPPLSDVNNQLDGNIASSEDLLRSLGYADELDIPGKNKKP